MEYTGENKNSAQSIGPDADHSIPLRTTPSRKGPILLKRNSQLSEINLCVDEETFNQSTVYQNQSGLVPVASTLKTGSDDDEGKPDAYKGEMYPSPDYLELDPDKICANVFEDKDQYEKVSVESNAHTDKKSIRESYPNFHDIGLGEKGGFKSDKEAASYIHVDPTESDLNASSQKTGAERNFSSDSVYYTIIEDIDDSGYMTPVHIQTRHRFEPVKPRPIKSTAFPLPPTPEVKTRPFSEADDDKRLNTGQSCGIEDLFYKLPHEKEDVVGKLRLPNPIELKDLNPHILKFLVKNKKHRHMFEKNLLDIYAVAKWPSSLKDSLIIKCTVNVNDKNASSLLKDWDARVVEKVKNFAAGIEVAEFNMILIAWPRVLKELRACRVDNPEDVGVDIEQDKYSITLAGQRGTMEMLKKSVKDMINMVISQIKTEEQKVTETKQMQTYAVSLLIESHFKNEIKKKYSGLQIDLNLKEKNVIFVGQVDIVQKAVVQMHKKLQSFASRSMQMSKAAKGLLFAKEVTDYIKQKMKSQKVIGVWDVDCKEEVRMFALNEGGVVKAIQLVRESILENEILLDDVMAENVKGEQWLKLVERIHEKHKQNVAIETSMKSILVVAKDDIFQDVSNKIKDYLQEQSVKELVLALNLVKIKFIKRYKMEDIKALEKQFESLHIKLFVIDYGDQQGIKINGTNDGCKALQTALAEMAKNVVTKEHAMVSRVGLEELFQCSTGREQLNLIAVRRKCLIEMKDSSTSVSMHLEADRGGNSSGNEDDADESNEPTDWQLSSDICGNSLDACGIKVSFLQGEIAKQRVDVIVNSTNQKLDLRIGAVSNNILIYGGDSIQRDCLQQYPNGIDPGKVVVTSGGNLSCKKVYHGYLKAYDRGKGKSLKLMKTFVQNCLKQADKSGFQSMAFPSLGTGKLGFPADEVGKLLVKCIQKFGKKTPTTSLKEIVLVVFPSDTNNIKAFTSMFAVHTMPSTSRKGRAVLSSDMPMDQEKRMYSFPHSIVLEVVEGDITKEMTDVIVNSVLPDFNFTQGQVSKAIFKAGGDSIQQECQDKVKDLKKDGFMVTKAGHLLCKMIIHIAAQNRRKEWENIIGLVLHHADQLQFKAISFPALGTGGKGLFPKKIAQAIYSACTDFANSQPVCLKKIRVILFQRKMLTAFVQTIDACRYVEEESRLSELPVAGTLVMERSKHVNFVFSITTDSELNFKATVEDLESFVKNELTEKVITSPREMIAKLTDKQVTEMNGMGQGQVMVSINRTKGVIKVSGTQREVLDTYETIMNYLREMERASVMSFVTSVGQQPPPVPESSDQDGTHGTTEELSGR